MASEGHSYDYDLFVVGTGSGGMRATRFAKSMFNVPKVGTCDMPFSQLSVDGSTIVSPNTVGGVGGTCVIRGCIPKKYFWFGSHYARELEDSKGYGWDVEVKGFNWQTLLTKKRKAMEQSNKFLSEKRLPGSGVEVLTGRGKFVDQHTLHVGAPANKTITAKTFLIATGCSPTVLDIPGKEFCISSDHILDLEECPKKLAIIGAGYIACEFACMFAAWGCETHLVYRKETPLRGFDDDCRAFLARQMEFKGVHLHPLHNPVRVEKGDDGKLTYVIKGADGTESSIAGCDHVLMATGRSPNTWELGLDKAGVELTKGGAVLVDDYNKTSVGNIFAIGDITDRAQLTPVAIQEAMNFLRNEYGNEPRRRKVDYALVAAAVFTQPPLGTCGLTEEEALQKYKNLDIWLDGAAGGMKPSIHKFSESKEEHMFKIIVDVDTDKVVGLHMVGKDSSEIMQGFAVAMKCGVKLQDFYETVCIHPTAAENFNGTPGIDCIPPKRCFRDGKPVDPPKGY